MKMRFRTDGWHYADLKVSGPPYYFDVHKAEFDATPKAEPGDVWRLHWGGNYEGPQRLAGYAICCPQCGRVHPWTTASNCNQKIVGSYVDSKTGETRTYESCVHSGRGSCWNWTGSAEDGTLSASPSLLVTLDRLEPGGCNWHGYLTDGDLHA